MWLVTDWKGAIDVKKSWKKKWFSGEKIPIWVNMEKIIILELCQE